MGHGGDQQRPSAQHGQLMEGGWWRGHLMMATVAIVWATMRVLLIVMVGRSSWLLVACWLSVLGDEKNEVRDGCGRHCESIRYKPS